MEPFSRPLRLRKYTAGGGAALRKEAFYEERETGETGKEGKRCAGGRKRNYMAEGMCFGLALGLIFGQAVFHNLALGMCMGLSIGMLFGMSVKKPKKEKAEEEKKEKENEKHAEN